MRNNIRFAGAGGQGVILSSVLLAKAYGLGEGYNISQTQSYGPEARGGACKAELVVSDSDIDYIKVDKADIFIAFNQVGYDKYCKNVQSDAKVLINSTLIETDTPDHYSIPATEMAESIELPVAVNIVMLGAVTRLLEDLSFETMKNEIIKNFEDKFRTGNLKAFEKGYRYMDAILENPTDISKRNNVMVCVTKQRTCDRLITYGKDILANRDGELFIIHVSQKRFSSFDQGNDAEALDYLYEKAMEYGTNLTVIRSDDTVGTLTNLVLKNEVDILIMGESHEETTDNTIIDKLKQNVNDSVLVKVISD